MRLCWVRAAAALLLSSCASDAIVQSVPTEPVAAWGDSLTWGGGAPDNFPNALSGILARPVFDGGVSGETSSQILHRVLADTAKSADVAIFWMGRNNFADHAQVESDIAAAVTSLHHARFIVLGVVNGDFADEIAGTAKHAAVLQLNAELAAIYRDHFIDIRRMLIASAGVADSDDVVADITPRSLRVDELHLNPAGNRVVAAQVAAALAAKNW